jgi:O-antigen/teichoic acid export membrane protein
MTLMAATIERARGMTGRLLGHGDLFAVMRGAAQVLAIRVAGAGLAYLTMILLARWLGVFEFGVYAYVWVWAVILGTFLPLGLHTSILRFVPDYLARQKWRRLHGFLRQSTVIVFAASILGALIAVGVVFALRGVMPSYYVLPMLVGIACVPLVALFSHLEGMSRAFGWVNLAYAPSYVARPLLHMLIVGALVFAGLRPTGVDALWAIALATLITLLLQAVLMMGSMRKRLPAAKPVYHTRHWMAISLPFLMIEGFQLLLEHTDVLMIGKILTPEDVAVYYAAIRTGGLIAFIYFAVAALAVPKFAEINAVSSRHEMQRFVSGIIQLMFWPSVVAAGALAIVGPFVLSLFGEGFAAGYTVLLIVLFGLVVRASTGPLEYLLNMTGHHMATARVYAVAGVLNIALNIALIPQLGIAGAAVSTYLSIFTANIWLYLIVRRRLGVSAFVLPLRF